MFDSALLYELIITSTPSHERGSSASLIPGYLLVVVSPYPPQTQTVGTEGTQPVSPSGLVVGVSVGEEVGGPTRYGRFRWYRILHFCFVEVLGDRIGPS